MDKLNWIFPLPRTHTGALLGNGLLGAMVWGGGDTLKITLGRGDLWDHRGGMRWTARQNFKAIRACLEANDEKGIADLFRVDTGDKPGQPKRPSIIPVGRIDLSFGKGACLVDADLGLRTGALDVRVRLGSRDYSLRVALDPERPVLALSLPPALRAACVAHGVPAWKLIGGELAAIGFKPPRRFKADSLCGWTQEMPVDPGVCVGWRVDGGTFVAAVERGATAAESRAGALSLVDAALKGGKDEPFARARRFWKRYWADVPEVRIPNPALQEIYDYGMYKFGAMTAPTGVAAGLQGPWIEEYQLPPWSSDYHFNINVQMCYWPAYRGNRLRNLMPLFDLIHSWLPTLRENARLFAGIDDGYMLPHAVDDRCVCMGSFWTGCIDHACTAWVAQMAYDYYRYTGDIRFLRERAFPFMAGAMRVYQAMLEKDGGALSLPVSISPEYRGCSMNAWGRNASFQLACIHRLAENLADAAAALGEKADPAWGEILGRLPKAAIVNEGTEWAQIGLWDGLILEESHRHHSHLGAIAPFDTIDVDDPEWRRIVENSLRHWTYRGMGLWSGWCMPWASMIHSRCGNGQMAQLVLEIWKRAFTNQGRGTLHDADFTGLTLLGGSSPFTGKGRMEVMQMDAGMGAVAAVQEMLVHERRGVIRVFHGVPRDWRDAAVNGIPMPGGFKVSAAKADGRLAVVKVAATRDGELRIANPWHGQGESARATLRGRPLRLPADEIISLRMKAGDVLEMSCR